MKRCELCDRAAKMYCESDQASLCWDCDAKVHSANFLVERHPRLLLCRRCQAPTTWRATGARLSPIISSCDRCTVFHKEFPSSEEQDENQVDVDEADSDEEEQEDCQVVPWRPTPTPPPPASSSSGEESSSLSSVKARSNNSLKRIREKEDFSSENDESRPFNRRRRSRHDLFFEGPFSSRIEGNGKDHRISLVKSDALFSVESGETGSCARRASTAVDLISSASCSPPI